MPNQSLYVTLAKMARDTVSQANYATETYSDTISGDCGGSASLTLIIDDTTYAVTGSFTFSNYCTAGSTMSGSMTFTGSYNESTGEYSMTMTISGLSSESLGETFTMTGTIATTIGSTSSTMTMNLTAYSSTDLKVYKMENYTITISDYSTYYDMSFSGRFYDPDYGYITVSMPTAFRYSSGASTPSQGTMVMTGANNVTAKMTTTSSTQYTIEVDLNGDGDYTDTDESVGTFTWTEDSGGGGDGDGDGDAPT